MTGQEFLKSEDPIDPVYTTVPQARPTELVDKLGLPGDIIRDAEIPMDRPEDLSDYPTKLMEAFTTQENEKSLDELLRETQIRKPYTFMDDTMG